MDRVEWKDKLSDTELQEELCLAFVRCWKGRTTPVVTKIYKRFPECQRHPTSKENQTADRNDIRDACRSFNIHHKRFDSERFSTVIQSQMQRELQIHAHILFPALKATITGIWDAIEAINKTKPEIGFRSMLEKMRAINESIDAQSKLLDLAIRFNQLLTPPNDDERSLKSGASKMEKETSIESHP